MASITSGLQSNELIQEDINNIKSKNHLGSFEVIVSVDTCEFTIKTIAEKTRIPIVILAVSQDGPLGILFGKLSNEAIDFLSYDLIKTIDFVNNQNGTTTITLTTNAQQLWSRWAIILPKEYII